MAVLSLTKLKSFKLSKLKALLLLGGALALATVIWTTANRRFVLDTSPQVPAGAVLAMRFKPEGKILQALPPDAQQALKVAGPGQSALTLFAVPDQSGLLQWGTLETMNSMPRGVPVWRLVPIEVDAVGFVVIGGRKQRLEAEFGPEYAKFRIGRDYSGFLGMPTILNTSARVLNSMSPDMIYLEKPEGASWAHASTLLGQEMQRFPALSAFWSLPGRVELSVSPVHAGTVLQPFNLYYHPRGSEALPRRELEAFAKNLLADALPNPVDIKLPDGSHMQELRHDPTAIQMDHKQNLYGETVEFSFPDQKESLHAFYTKAGDAWLTTDINLVVQVFMSRLQVFTPDACHKGGSGGFAMFPGSFLPFPNGFKALTVTIHNLETGLFTICGYY